MPRVLRVDPRHPEPHLIAEAVDALARGKLVAFPTETVYGLGASGLHPDHVRRIFDAKQRPLGHPVILHVDGIAMARSLAREWSALGMKLAEAFWPGPLTLVVPRALHVPDAVTGGLESVGLRMPAHPVALALVEMLGEPIAAPSANAHMHVSPTTAEHVVRSLGERVDLVLDAGPCAHGIESTVVSLGDPPLVLRPGSISVERLATLAPSIRLASATIAGDAPRASPGQAARHYAPHARVVLAARGDPTPYRAGSAAIVATEAARMGAKESHPLFVLPDEPGGYARGIFAALHAVDMAAAEEVVIEDVPRDEPAWTAVADRLARAARR